MGQVTTAALACGQGALRDAAHGARTVWRDDGDQLTRFTAMLRPRPGCTNVFGADFDECTW